MILSKYEMFSKSRTAMTLYFDCVRKYQRAGLLDIQRYVEDEISEMILKGEIKEGQTINVTLENDNLRFNAN